MTAVETAIAPENSFSIRGALLWGAQVLSDAGIENHRLDAEVLLRHVLKMEKEQLYMNGDTPISAGQEAEFRALLSRRSQREPVSYITGQKEFSSLDFFVTPAVLIPRPETELLVEVALQYIARLGCGSPVKVLDLGTGSGAIAVSLAKDRGAMEIVAVDICPVALDLARVNAVRHGVADRIRFLPGDLFAPLKETPEIREWEPTIALDGGVDGADTYRRIIGEGHRYLTPRGSIVLEIGADMGGDVAGLFSRSNCYGPPAVCQDYACKDRVIAAPKLRHLDRATKSISHG